MKALLFAATALGQTGCYVALVRLGNLRLHVPETLCIFGCAFLLYVLTLRLLHLNMPLKHGTASGKRFLRRNRFLLAVLGLAVLYRGILLPAVPSLSDDIYRYIWEGRVVSEGFNPFSLAPDSPALAPLRDAAVFPLVSRPNLASIYPPMAQFIFATASSLSYSLSSMKAVFILFDLGIITILLFTLPALGISPLRAAVYALNPLVIVEFSGSGHLDCAGIFFMMLALYLCLKRKSLWSAAALALSFLVKLFPVLLLPALLTKRKSASALVFFCLASAAFLPFLDAGHGLFRSLGLYTMDWMFNSPMHTLLLQLVKNNQIARLIGAGIFITIASGMYYGYFKNQNLEKPETVYHICFMLLGAFLLCTPVVHPWYVCWMVPFLAIAPNRAWLFLSGAVFGSYWVLREYAATGLWLESPAALYAQYIPFISLLLFDCCRHMRERKKPCAES